MACVSWLAIVALGGINSGDAWSAEVAIVTFEFTFSGSSCVSAEDSEVSEVSSSSLVRFLVPEVALPSTIGRF